ncbi:hypothetical protein GCM10011519_20910 [Marmoricola endophyticus]|uniref:DUF885 domain-containing protein n=1 Tax=Marmoricola endophyticus TaxID=2040280 RepID=A0A917BKG7_9ACTN|nr:DUF885 domain-containing protein [Marmoricola endophyticus]GGF46741.1 hypothetical protein GCM10011519_20910 [Marmoricola endophyticus]
MTADDAARDLDDLTTAFWDHYLESNPTEAHLLGIYRYAGFVEDSSRAAEDRTIETMRTFASDAEAIDPGGLDDQQRLSRELLVHHADDTAAVLGVRLPELGADPIFGPQEELPIVLGMLGLPDAGVAEAMADKLHGFGRQVDQLTERLREGVASGRTPAAFAVTDTVGQIDDWLARPINEDPLLAAVPAPPATLDEAAWRERLGQVVADVVRPAFAAYADVLRTEVLPHARPDEECGLGALPDGEASYATMLRHSTTTDLTAQQIHDIGLEQVAKLAEEYRALGPDVVGSDDLGTIFERLRTDPALHYERGEELVSDSVVAMDRAWAAMPDWFETLPQARCEVQGTDGGAKAFYFPPASDGSRGGTFFINTEEPESWGRFELESMAFHEGIPGHHLQLTIAGELSGLPDFRKHLHHNAYAEGWGLYTERLADEMGLYAGPVDRIGMLAADSMRACRLVVDTGLHALGWSRQQAVDYMVDNSPLTPAMVRPEIDRYICSPGQATGYMVGRLEILRMRAEAQGRQGAGFDVRRFHSAVLDSGSLPLDVLDRVVAARLPA